MAAPDAPAAPHRRILAIVVALIVYGSLYPWHFYQRHYFHNPLYILFHSWPATVDRYMLWDIGVNITLYVPLGIFAFLSIGPRASRATRILAPLAFATILSASIEMIQLFDDSRTCSLSDLASNALGAGVGIAVGSFYRTRLRRLVAAQDAAVLMRASGALLLLACWLGYQVFPLFPAWGRTSLFNRLAALRSSPLSPVDSFVVFSEWIAIACLVDSIRKNKSKTIQSLALLLLLVPLRLIVRSRTLTWSELVGAAAAFAAWLTLPRLWLRRAAPSLLSCALVLGELSPFHFIAASASHPFIWVPFRSFFTTLWQDGFVTLFRKSFWYGSVLWLWRASGRSLLWTTLITAAVLFLLEQAQVFLPSRTAEITDSLLAVIMGVVLWLLRDA